MKNQELFDKSVGALLKAYNTGTLEHGVCTSCAVGNLICDNLYQGNFPAWEKDFEAFPNSNWNAVFEFGQLVRIDFYDGRAKRQIDATGYSIDDLVSIENAFENIEGKYFLSKIIRMQKGVTAVIDQLAIIHEATTEEAEAAKLLFVK